MTALAVMYAVILLALVGFLRGWLIPRPPGKHRRGRDGRGGASA